MRIFAAVISLASVVACASGGANPSTSGALETTRITSGSQIALDNVNDEGRSKAVANASIAEVWRVLPSVLDSLGVKVATVNSTTYDIGNTGLDVRRQLGSTMVSKYFDCPAGGAMSLDLFVSVVVHLDPASPSTTNLLTRLAVKGKPISYSGGWVNCSSTGVLEQRIAEGVNARLGR
ncbi:MAG: hypothetical protein ABJE10_21760 [bacterium]